METAWASLMLGNRTGNAAPLSTPQDGVLRGIPIHFQASAVSAYVTHPGLFQSRPIGPLAPSLPPWTQSLEIPAHFH